VWLALLVLAGLGSSALLLPSIRPGRSLRPTPLSYRDLGVSCLALGSVSPPVEELSDEQFESLTTLLARLMHAYEAADFDSFLALRAGDVGFAGELRAHDIDVLRGFCRQLSVPEEKLGGGWLEVLESFWRAYYARPPVARFLPEGTRIELHTEGLRGGSTQDWELSFEALRDRVPGPLIQHELVIPHRRSVERIASDVGPFVWLDLELAFETQAAAIARLVARFVWDGIAGEWFLQRAATVYTRGDRSDRHLIL